MNHARFWTGLVFLGGLPMGLLLGLVRETVPIESTLEGHVRCHGRPMAGGVVYFNSQDCDHASDVIAEILPDGTFSCRSVWLVDDGSRVRFKVHVYKRLEPPQSSAPPSGPAPGFSPPAVPAPVSSLLGSFEISLGAEPTALEIDLKD